MYSFSVIFLSLNSNWNLDLIDLDISKLNSCEYGMHAYLGVHFLKGLISNGLHLAMVLESFRPLCILLDRCFPKYLSSLLSELSSVWSELFLFDPLCYSNDSSIFKLSIPRMTFVSLTTFSLSCMPTLVLIRSSFLSKSQSFF